MTACGGGGSGSTQGQFLLIQFLESGQNNVPRNRTLTFGFSGPVMEGQDFAERLQIDNVQSGANSNFSRAIGVYVVVADRVSFAPRLPQIPDRTDAGLRENGSYIVFLKSGPDALQAADGDAIRQQQEFNFNTSDVFEDPLPLDPPRALRLFARDTTTQEEIDLSRLDPRPDSVRLQDSATLIANDRVIEPGAGGAPNFGTPWEFNLQISEPIDPATIRTANIELTEIFEDATTTDDASDPGATDGHFGTAVNFPVPINVSVSQGIDESGEIQTFIRVVPLFTLVDDTRYRIRFSGSILGVDFRKTFIGDNGLTGDGTTIVSGLQLFPEPGGLGYVAHFIVRDRPSITGTRTLTYDPLSDRIEPEDGTTTNDPTQVNNALYNPVSNPSETVGFLAAFGTGADGDLAASGIAVTTLDAGDTPNEFMGNPFSVTDINPNNLGNTDTRPGGLLTYDSLAYTEFNFKSVTISGSATLQVTGANPVMLRVAGLVQINGTLDVTGAPGTPGGIPSIARGGEGGPGGFAGGDSRPNTDGTCTFRPNGCSNFQTILDACAATRNRFPYSDAGEGPGRGQPGGLTHNYPSTDQKNALGGTGGGGGSHASRGTDGEDRRNAGDDEGTNGDTCTTGFMLVRNSGMIGVRSVAGPTYGDNFVVDIVMGGSGGGAGGGTQTYSTFTPGKAAGGAGGGGGGSVAIIASAGINIPGGTIDARGGPGGRGGLVAWSGTSQVVQGGGGGGAGGTIVLIAGADIAIAGATLDARGGAGGARGLVQGGASCAACNGGGAGGKGYVFMMDADGVITGSLQATPGTYDIANSVTTISAFDASRFEAILSVTRLFNVLAANPDYLDLVPGDIRGFVSPGQRIRVRMSSAKADPLNPLNAELDTEIGVFEIALIRFDAGSVVVDITGDADNLNPALQTPARDAFIRVVSEFEYDNGPEAALGPFATVDSVTVSFTFN